MRSRTPCPWPIGVTLFLLSMAGCNYFGPGAEGTVTLAAEVELPDVAYLHLVTCPWDQGELTSPSEQSCEGEPVYRSTQRVYRDSFPLGYHVGAVNSATSPYEHWIVVAWISDQEESAWPEPGQWYGSARYDAGKCSATSSRYCGPTKGVDLTIDATVPLDL